MIYYLILSVGVVLFILTYRQPRLWWTLWIYASMIFLWALAYSLA